MHGDVEKDLKDIKEALKDVKKIIAVASGKGGVGKSTISAGLAVALKQKGFKTGLLDADVYGPSIPELFGVNEKPLTFGDKMAPIDAGGIKLMSVGFLVDEKAAMIWRGPMMSSVIRQLLKDVIWEDLDYLVIDLPIAAKSGSPDTSQKIPSWIKNNAGWWADGSIDDNSFVQGIQFLIKEGIMKIPQAAQDSEPGGYVPQNLFD